VSKNKRSSPLNKKKFKRQQQAGNRPWLFVAVVGVLFVIAALFLSNQDEGGTPSIAVDQQKIDYGDVKLGVNKSFAIRVTNTGDGALRFKEEPYIEILEGC
jgi:hypothetical protein